MLPLFQPCLYLGQDMGYKEAPVYVHGKELLCHQLHALSYHGASVNWWLVRSVGMAGRLHCMNYCVVLGLLAIVYYLCHLTVSWDNQSTRLLGCIMLG